MQANYVHVTNHSSLCQLACSSQLSNHICVSDDLTKELMNESYIH